MLLEKACMWCYVNLVNAHCNIFKHRYPSVNLPEVSTSVGIIRGFQNKPATA